MNPTPPTWTNPTLPPDQFGIRGPLPASLVWVRRLLLLLVALQVVYALTRLFDPDGSAAYRSGSSLGAAAVAAMLFYAGHQLEQAGPRRFLGIMAVGILQILGGLARIGNMDASGLVIAVLATTVLVLVTRSSARGYLRGR